MWAIIKKEVKTYFLSPIGYVFIGIFLLAFSISFNLELAYSNGIIDFKSIFIHIFTYLPTILIFAFLIPMLTMRTFSEERKNGTEQLLLTSPISLIKIILAKFISVLAIVLIGLLFTGIFLAIICFFGTPDIPSILVTLLGFLLLCMAYIAFGIFASSITENQIIAAMISIITFVISWVLPEFLSLGASFSLMNMFYKFTTGQIDIAYTITYLAFTILFIGLTVLVMQKRRSINLLVKKVTTIIFIVSFVLIFIALSLWVNNLNLNPIDFTTEKLYTLTDISKEKLKDIDKDVNLYFVEYAETDSIIDLAKQYDNVNDKITVEVVKTNDRPDLRQKYNIDENISGIIIESGEKFKILTQADFYTYNVNESEEVDITEEKLTNAILYVTSENIPTVCFLEGYSNFNISENMTYLARFLENEVTDIKTLNIITEGKVPDYCNTLIINTPAKDFDDITTKAIEDYINNGGNILWLNLMRTEEQNLSNVNKILSLYGIKPFSVGYINETDATKMMSESPNVILPSINYTTVTKNIPNVLMVNATKLNFVSDEELGNLKVEKINLLETSFDSYFRTNFDNMKLEKEDNEEQGSFIVGAELVKTIEEATEEQTEKKSKLIVYAENLFISDYGLSTTSNYPLISYLYNKDLIIDTISYLNDRQEDIEIRKVTNRTTYTATVEQNNIIQSIIFAVPVIIIFVGILVWQHRRRKNK